MSKKFFAFLCLFTLFFASPAVILANDELYLGGDSIGIEVDYDGIVVSGTYPISVEGKTYDPSSEIHVKDKIISVDGTMVKSLSDLSAQLSRFQKTVNAIPIEVLRNEEKIPLTLTTVYDSSMNAFKSGLYVKDKIIGVGTMTFYDPSTGRYGALGHEIMDMDLKEIADVHTGVIYPADVKSVTKSQKNAPGEKQANIDFTKVLGQVDRNTNIGIYGTYNQVPANALKLPWAKKEEIKTGQAYIYTVIKGQEVKKYSIQITKLHSQSAKEVKGIEFTVDDKELLAATNGIVQGMSGSPIVQNDQIIGAVTHVITSNPMNGYGVYIEWMLENTRN